MCHEDLFDDKLLELLAAEDARVARITKAAGCPRCGGRLDRADYPRKPRGGPEGTAERRLSFCCCRDGCRRRATPPSLVFLGRRVYLGMAVLLETLAMTASICVAARPSRCRSTPARVPRLRCSAAFWRRPACFSGYGGQPAGCLCNCATCGARCASPPAWTPPAAGERASAGWTHGPLPTATSRRASEIHRTEVR